MRSSRSTNASIVICGLRLPRRRSTSIAATIGYPGPPKLRWGLGADGGSMRVLFTCYPIISHFLPLTPFAGALRDAGHEVAFTTPLLLRDAVKRSGFPWIQSGIENDEPEMASIGARHRELRGAAQVRFTMEEIFTGVRPRRLVPDLIALAETWRPDILVRDNMEFGGMVAAEMLDIPHVKVLLNAA